MIPSSACRQSQHADQPGQAGYAWRPRLSYTTQWGTIGAPLIEQLGRRKEGAYDLWRRSQIASWSLTPIIRWRKRLCGGPVPAARPNRQGGSVAGGAGLCRQVFRTATAAGCSCSYRAVAIPSSPASSLMLAYAGRLVKRASDKTHITLEIIRSGPHTKGFEVPTRRLVVDHTFAWLFKNRRLHRCRVKTRCRRS